MNIWEYRYISYKLGGQGLETSTMDAISYFRGTALMRRRKTHKVQIFKPGKRILQRNPYMILKVMLQLVSHKAWGFF